METSMDVRWKLSKKDSRRRSAAMASVAGGSPVGLKGWALWGPTQSVPGRFVRLVKEQRARFYIMRRCVTMLVCWRD